MATPSAKQYISGLTTMGVIVLGYVLIGIIVRLNSPDHQLPVREETGLEANSPTSRSIPGTAPPGDHVGVDWPLGSGH